MVTRSINVINTNSENRGSEGGSRLEYIIIRTAFFLENYNRFKSCGISVIPGNQTISKEKIHKVFQFQVL